MNRLRSWLCRLLQKHFQGKKWMGKLLDLCINVIIRPQTIKGHVGLETLPSNCAFKLPLLIITKLGSHLFFSEQTQVETYDSISRDRHKRFSL